MQRNICVMDRNITVGTWFCKGFSGKFICRFRSDDYALIGHDSIKEFYGVTSNSVVYIATRVLKVEKNSNIVVSNNFIEISRYERKGDSKT